MNEYTCPKCGKKTMVKQKNSNGKYILICQVCGFKRGTLPKDHKRGVV
jgi:transcription elongation factor Elf1